MLLLEEATNNHESVFIANLLTRPVVLNLATNYVINLGLVLSQFYLALTSTTKNPYCESLINKNSSFADKVRE